MINHQTVPAGTKYKTNSANGQRRASDPGSANKHTNSTDGNLTPNSRLLDDGNVKATAGPATCSCAENQHLIKGKNIDFYYTEVDSLGKIHKYGTYDSTKELARFASFGLAFCLFVLSIYIYKAATRLYTQFFDKKRSEKSIDVTLTLLLLFLNGSYVLLIPTLKGLPLKFLSLEFILYPSQFILGISFSSLLLLGFGTYRVLVVTTTRSLREGKQKELDRKVSFITLVSGLLALLANCIQIWSVFM